MPDKTLSIILKECNKNYWAFTDLLEFVIKELQQLENTQELQDKIKQKAQELIEKKST